MLDIPYVGPDGIADLTKGGADGAFITLAGVENSGNTYGSVAGVHDICRTRAPSSRTTRLRSVRLRAPTAHWPTPAPRSCSRPSTPPSPAAQPIRPPSVKASAPAVFCGAPVDTVLGPLTVDPNGDSGT